MDPKSAEAAALRQQLLRRSRTGVPSWAIASALGLAVVATYYYSMYAVGTTDIDAAVQQVQDDREGSSK